MFRESLLVLSQLSTPTIIVYGVVIKLEHRVVTIIEDETMGCTGLEHRVVTIIEDGNMGCRGLEHRVATIIEDGNMGCAGLENRAVTIIENLVQEYHTVYR